MSQHTDQTLIWLILNNETHVQDAHALYMGLFYAIENVFYCIKQVRRARKKLPICQNQRFQRNPDREKEKIMGIAELFLLAVGLSMDAFAVSVCKGLAMKKCTARKAMICGVWFGGFQALMPLIGYLLGSNFEKYITAIDHWIAFVLLGIIGGSMLMEACSKKEEEELDESLDVKTMFLLAIATSIDALAVGITLAFLPDTNISAAVIFIGIITFLLSSCGVKIGNVFGEKYKKKAEITGGVILIALGLKILLEHLEILPPLF